MGFAKGFTGSFKALRSGEVREFTHTLQAARHHAVERMVEQALYVVGPLQPILYKQ